MSIYIYVCVCAYEMIYHITHKNQIIEGRERTLGFHHEDTLQAKLMKGNLLLDTNSILLAEALFRELVDQLHSDPLGRFDSVHPLNINAFFGLATVWRLKAIHESQPIFAAAAEQIFSCVYTRYVSLYGEKSQDSIKALYGKALAVESQRYPKVIT
jgi:hypothetical protein